MKELCFRGRTDEVEDREPILNSDGRRVLRYPSEACGHVDELRWLPEADGRLLWEKAIRRHERSSEEQRVA